MDENYWPKITIVTPSYNQGDYLEETIQSILSQGYANLEYFVLDGGSTDGSVEIIRKYEDKLTHWESGPDGGQSSAINKGFRMASGEILTWLNSDDYYLPGTLQEVGNIFRQHPMVECLYGDLHIVDKNSDLLYVSKAVPYDYRTMLYGGARVPQPASFYRRRVVEKVGYLDTGLEYHMDVEYFIRFGKYGVQFMHIPKALTCFRMHIASKAENEDAIVLANRDITTRYSGQFFKNEKLNDAALNMLRFIFRVKAFSKRAITRRDFLPFQTKFARRKARKI